MFQYVAGFIAGKMIYSRAKKAYQSRKDLEALKAYGAKINFPYLGEKVEDYRKKLMAERDRLLKLNPPTVKAQDLAREDLFDL